MQHLEEKQIILIIGGVILLSALVAFILLFLTLYQKRYYEHLKEKEILKKDFEQQLLQSQLETQEETISVLGKELHDNVGQLLNSAKLLIGVTQRKLTDSHDTLTIADDTLSKAINELRSLSKSLNKEWLQQFNFIENLETEIQRINASGKLQIALNIPPLILLDADKQIILFRIVQESLQNAIKHARATVINVSVVEQSDKLLIRVSDNGAGLGINTIKGIGILNIVHRAKLLGGKADWQSEENKGTTVSIQIPIKQ